MPRVSPGFLKSRLPGHVSPREVPRPAVRFALQSRARPPAFPRASEHRSWGCLSFLLKGPVCPSDPRHPLTSPHPSEPQSSCPALAGTALLPAQLEGLASVPPLLRQGNPGQESHQDPVRLGQDLGLPASMLPAGGG